ncbi:shikimate kinase [Catalinimonas alkaloidigena]|uniref:Shikimate kinase n=1 Tax=Catalinimonas alkaloidigena TaxID=1075417 RepID=A0A1G9MUX3_9BACT|nr:shikimate kinase [Catalinimonas alkaloidigena]SDL78038.1 shikimate kinase [Catalinimonas alkaloidigena]
MTETIFLIGMPGCGKSTLGRALAAALDYTFVDLDAQIEADEGRTIRDIFAQDGEVIFREIEARTLRKVAAQPHTIVATGGGTPCFHDNLAVIHAQGISLFLDTSLSTILARMEAAERAVRPLLAQEDLKAKLEELYTRRISYYAQADLRIPEADSDVSSVLQKLQERA